jgi:hypothetical protein
MAHATASPKKGGARKKDKQEKELRKNEQAKRASKPDKATTAEEVFEQLPQDLRETLGMLHDVPKGIAELTLASLPVGSRVFLAGTGVVKTGEGQPRDLSLTKLGRKTMKLCEPFAPDEDADLDQEITLAQRHLAAAR